MTRMLQRALVGSLNTGLFQAADANRPHPHRGRLEPYGAPPAPLSLSDEEAAKLQTGEAVFTQVAGASGGRGAAVFIVEAPAKRIWEVILSFDRYPEFIPEVTECEVYEARDGEVYTRFVISKVGMSVEYFVRHCRPLGADWMTWTLDYERRSDLDDSVGMWRVTPVEDRPGCCRVEYSVELQIDGWVPDFVRGVVVESGLRGATSWVKVQSEGR